MPHQKRAESSVHANHVTSTRLTHSALWRSYFKNPSEARHEALWLHYQPLVKHVAERFNDKMAQTFDVSALIDAGNVGLLDAIADFSAASTTRFEMLAVPMIRRAITRSLAVQRARAKEYVLRMELADAIAHSDATAPRAESNSSSAVVTQVAKAIRQKKSRA